MLINLNPKVNLLSRNRTTKNVRKQIDARKISELTYTVYAWSIYEPETLTSGVAQIIAPNIYPQPKSKERTLPLNICTYISSKFCNPNQRPSTAWSLANVPIIALVLPHTDKQNGDRKEHIHPEKRFVAWCACMSLVGMKMRILISRHALSGNRTTGIITHQRRDYLGYCSWECAGPKVFRQNAVVYSRNDLMLRTKAKIIHSICFQQ